MENLVVNELPDAIEPDFWNVVFYPSDTRFNRLVLGRFQHVSAFAYVPGFRAWVVYDSQWGGLRVWFLNHVKAMEYAANLFAADCAVIKCSRQYHRLALFSRLGFYCVPAIKQLLGLSCVAATPDGLYRYLLNNGGEILGQRIDTAAAAAGSDAARGKKAGAGGIS